MRLERGDLTGEAQVRTRLAELDQAEVEVRVAGAQARADVGDADSAVQRLKAAAADLQGKGKHAEALQLLTEAAMLDPGDSALRQTLVGTYIAAGDFDSACQFATEGGEFRRIADGLFEARRDDEGINVLAMAVEVDPADRAVRAELANRLAERGDFEGARGALSTDGDSSDSEMLWTGAQIDIREGRLTEGLVVLERLLADQPGRGPDLAAFGCALAERDVEAGFACVEAAARAAIAADAWERAAAALTEFSASVPGHIPALMRLVEICVDGGLDDRMRDGQEQLVDAYLAEGAGREAKIIAEDLVSQDPSNAAHVERLRRAQVLLGEAVVASAETPASSEPLSLEAVLQTLRDDVVREASPESVAKLEQLKGLIGR
jgi:Flp pilus assembly protein TadD